MEKKEYLNETEYQKNKKAIVMIALLVLICGILIGGGLIVTGIVMSSNVQTQSERSKEDIELEIDTINNELISLKAKQDKEFMINGMSEEFYRLENEILNKDKKVSKLEDELWKIESGFHTVENRISKSKYIPFYMFGAFIIIGSLMISGFIYLFAKHRDILSFQVQQIMPIAQEGMEKMAPTFGNVSKEIAKGIKEGIKEEKE